MFSSNLSLNKNGYAEVAVDLSVLHEISAIRLLTERTSRNLLDQLISI